MGCLLPKTLTSKMWKCVYFCFKFFRNICLFAYIHRYTHKHMYVFVCMSKNETLVCFYCEPRRKVWAGLCLSCLCNRQWRILNFIGFPSESNYSSCALTYFTRHCVKSKPWMTQIITGRKKMYIFFILLLVLFLIMYLFCIMINRYFFSLYSHKTM